MADVTFTKAKQNRIYENIVNQVLEAVKRGDLKPHDKLPSEKELGTLFGVSRMTVREAIQSLTQSGIVEVQQGSMGGAYIREVNLEDVAGQIRDVLRMTNVTLEQLVETRCALEWVVLTRLIPEKLKEEDLEKLGRNIASAESHYLSGDQDERLSDNCEFHLILAEITGNVMIIFLLKIVLDMFFSFIDKVQPSENMIKENFANHKAIADALREKNFPKAGEACLHDIRQSYAGIYEQSRQRALLGG
jgi:GntR family transcriptional repressor for pyruvate dehydrogenase complex